MNEEYIIDGTSIINNAEKERTLSPLLQLLLLLRNKGNNFYCYFDADTRYKLERDADKQIYQNLVKFGLDDYFVQVSSLDADEALLEQADAANAKIISCDNFEDYYDKYPWLAVQSNQRLIKVDVIAEKLIIDALHINMEVERNLVEVTKELVQLLESSSDRLHGVIDKYKKERQFGFIKRAGIGKNLFFSKKSVSDKNLDYTNTSTPVSFKLDIGQSGSIYYFCASDVKLKEEKPVEETVAALKDERQALQQAKQQIQEQTAKARAAIEQELQAVKSQNETLVEENKVLQEQVNTYKGTDNHTIKRLQAQQQEHLEAIEKLNEANELLMQTISKKGDEIDALKKRIAEIEAERDRVIIAKRKVEEESNELAMVVDVQGEKIKNLDEDLRSTLQMFEFQDLDEAESVQYDQLKKNYSIAVNALRRKNSKIMFLANNVQDLQRQLSMNVEETTDGGAANTNLDALLERIQELERANTALNEEVKSLSTAGEANSDTPKTPTYKSTQKTAKRKPLKAKPVTAEPAEEHSTDKEQEYSTNTSRPRRLAYKPKERIIQEIPRGELVDWWNNLSEDWQKAFNQAVLSRGEILNIPSDEQLRSLFERQKIDIVGSGILLFGLNQLSFKLNDLSGIKDLKQITELNLSGHDFTDLDGIDELPALEYLNCTSNRIGTLRHIRKLFNLKTLIIRDNDLINLDGIEDLEELEYLNGLYNQSLRSIAGVEDLSKLQVLCVPNYKTRIINELKKLRKVNPNVEVRNV